LTIVQIQFIVYLDWNVYS